MTRKELIDKLFDEFVHDKEIITKNLLMAMDTIHLETSSPYEKITLQVKIERLKDNDKVNK